MSTMSIMISKVTILVNLPLINLLIRTQNLVDGITIKTDSVLKRQCCEFGYEYDIKTDNVAKTSRNRSSSRICPDSDGDSIIEGTASVDTTTSDQFLDDIKKISQNLKDYTLSLTTVPQLEILTSKPSNLLFPYTYGIQIRASKADSSPNHLSDLVKKGDIAGVRSIRKILRNRAYQLGLHEDVVQKFMAANIDSNSSIRLSSDSPEFRTLKGIINIVQSVTTVASTKSTAAASKDDHHESVSTTVTPESNLESSIIFDYHILQQIKKKVVSNNIDFLGSATSKYTPLHAAVDQNNYELTKELLDFEQEIRKREDTLTFFYKLWIQFDRQKPYVIQIANKEYDKLRNLTKRPLWGVGSSVSYESLIKEFEAREFGQKYDFRDRIKSKQYEERILREKQLQQRNHLHESSHNDIGNKFNHQNLQNYCEMKVNKENRYNTFVRTFLPFMESWRNTMFLNPHNLYNYFNDFNKASKANKEVVSKVISGTSTTVLTSDLASDFLQEAIQIQEGVFKNTPLHLAIEKGSDERMIKLLTSDKYGNTRGFYKNLTTDIAKTSGVTSDNSFNFINPKFHHSRGLSEAFSSILSKRMMYLFRQFWIDFNAEISRISQTHLDQTFKMIDNDLLELSQDIQTVYARTKSSNLTSLKILFEMFFTELKIPLNIRLFTDKNGPTSSTKNSMPLIFNFFEAENDHYCGKIDIRTHSMLYKERENKWETIKIIGKSLSPMELKEGHSSTTPQQFSQNAVLRVLNALKKKLKIPDESWSDSKSLDCSKCEDCYICYNPVKKPSEKAIIKHHFTGPSSGCNCRMSDGKTVIVNPVHPKCLTMWLHNRRNGGRCAMCKGKLNWDREKVEEAMAETLLYEIIKEMHQHFSTKRLEGNSESSEKENNIPRLPLLASDSGPANNYKSYTISWSEFTKYFLSMSSELKSLVDNVDSESIKNLSKWIIYYLNKGQDLNLDDVAIPEDKNHLILFLWHFLKFNEPLSSNSHPISQKFPTLHLLLGKKNLRQIEK